jgi:hypothetical protein
VTFWSDIIYAIAWFALVVLGIFVVAASTTLVHVVVLFLAIGFFASAMDQVRNNKSRN